MKIESRIGIALVAAYVAIVLCLWPSSKAQEPRRKASEIVDVRSQWEGEVKEDDAWYRKYRSTGEEFEKVRGWFDLVPDHDATEWDKVFHFAR